MFQNKIFNKILAAHGGNQAEALQQVSNILFLNKSNVYRRFSGKISLKLEEIETLAKRYNFSLDHLIHEEVGQYPMELFEIGKQDESEHYALVLSIVSQQAAHPDNILSISNVDWSYPVYTAFPEVHYFKVIQWQRLMWQHSSVRYSLKNIPNKMIDFLNSYQDYSEDIDMVFFLEKNTGTLFLEQVRYTFEMGVMTNDDLKKILVVYRNFINDLEHRVAIGRRSTKENAAKFEVYMLHYPLQNFLLLNQSKNLSFVQGLLNSPMHIHSSSPTLIERVAQFFRNLKNQGTKISETGEVVRRNLFTHYRNQIRQLEKELFD